MEVHILLKLGLENFETHKNIYFGFIDYTKAFNCVDHIKLYSATQH